MRIAIASDHAGFAYKQKLIDLLTSWGHEVDDFGTDSTESVDYPRFIRPAAEAVARGDADRAIVLGGSGNGEAMVANRVPGVRCALVWSEETARLARRHNDANAIAIGERLMSWELVESMVRIWLDTPFEGGRHVQRIETIETSDTTAVRDT
jgi:ribose 5-phosphate isomerase B